MTRRRRGRCDTCERSPERSEDRRCEGWQSGQRVVHDRWGAGEVAQAEDGQITVVFESVGYKTLDARLVDQRGLLTRA